MHDLTRRRYRDADKRVLCSSYLVANLHCLYNDRANLQKMLNYKRRWTCACSWIRARILSKSITIVVRVPAYHAGRLWTYFRVAWAQEPLPAYNARQHGRGGGRFRPAAHRTFFLPRTDETDSIDLCNENMWTCLSSENALCLERTPRATEKENVAIFYKNWPDSKVQACAFLFDSKFWF